MSPSRSRRRTSAAVILILAGLVAGSAAPALGQASSPSQGPDAPVSSGPVPGPAFQPEPTVVEPDPTLVDQRETPWQQVAVGPDGRTLTVTFWSGVDTCYGLARVEVERTGATLGIRLWTGTRPEAQGQACIELAQLYATVVTLEDPLITGGAG